MATVAPQCSTLECACPWNENPDLLGVLTGGDGYFQGCNPAWYVRIEWTAGRFLVLSILALIHPDDVERTSMRV